MTEFTSDEVKRLRKSLEFSHGTYCEKYLERALDHIERLQKRVEELEVQLKSKDIIINNQQGRLNYCATKDLLGGKHE